MKGKERIENEMIFSSVHTINEHTAFGILH